MALPRREFNLNAPTDFSGVMRLYDDLHRERVRVSGQPLPEVHRRDDTSFQNPLYDYFKSRETAQAYIAIRARDRERFKRDWEEKFHRTFNSRQIKLPQDITRVIFGLSSKLEREVQLVEETIKKYG